MDHFIAPVLPETETQWPSDTLGESVTTFSLSLVSIWRRFGDQKSLYKEETAGDKTKLQTRRARALLTRENGRDGPKSQVGRMDRIDAHFLHLEKSDSSAEMKWKRDAAKRNERKKRAHTYGSFGTRHSNILTSCSLVVLLFLEDRSEFFKLLSVSKYNYY